MFRKRLFIFLSLALMVSCSKGPMKDLKDFAVSKIISNRPQNYDQFMALIRLKNPGLLATAKKVDGKTVIDEALREAVLQEQAAFEKVLSELSNEIVVINHYRLVLNGLAIVAPKKLEGQIKGLQGISYVENEGSFARPLAEILDHQEENVENLKEKNSVSFIGAKRVQTELGVTGKGIKVGIIDTGIDYTHSMFGGEGTQAAFEAIDPSKDSDKFPSAKVVGGIDLVGTEYNSASGLFKYHIPKPDKNPIDEQGHGSHVAGTVAGKGDGLKSYSGVAPDADLYAIKVFGKDGSTGDTVIVAALEYAADPNGDLNPDDKLDVVNLSLGSPYGKPHILYQEAVKNLVAGGTIAVASAGNSGNLDYITGAPATVSEAISVAASIDGMDHNYKFRAVKLQALDEELFVEAVEAGFSKPIAEAGDIKGKFVFVGILDADLTDEQAAKLSGNIALIDRGKVPFSEKVKRAQAAGALAAVVANNVDGAAFGMGGADKTEIPAIMITKAMGDKLKSALESDQASIEFQTDVKIEKPELIDTLTGFSSKGPRSMDSHLKPEISAPGASIISAAFGKGDETVKMSGTSMAAPHITGVMALLKQHRNSLSAAQLKSLLLSSATTISDENEAVYPVSRQGAGRVQTFQAATQKLVFDMPTISLGEVSLEQRKYLRKKILVTNTSDQELSFELRPLLHKNLEFKGIKTLTLQAGETQALNVGFILTASEDKSPVTELDGFLTFVQGDIEMARIPVLAVAKKITQLIAKSLNVFSTSSRDRFGAATDLVLKNEGLHEGQALIFNLLGQDDRKVSVGSENSTRTRSCDLQSAGYRVIEKTTEEGDLLKVLQIGVKLFNPVTVWQPCEVSVLIDQDGDNKAEQELVGVVHDAIKGLDSDYRYSSFLFDAKKVREFRGKYEADLALAADSQARSKVEENYLPAIIDMQGMRFYNNSTISVIEVDVSKLAVSDSGHLYLKLGVLNEDRSAINADDYLENQLGQWKKIGTNKEEMSFSGMPEVVTLQKGEQKTVELEAYSGQENLVVYFPQNNTTPLFLKKDQQEKILKPTFGFGL